MRMFRGDMRMIHIQDIYLRKDIYYKNGSKDMPLLFSKMFLPQASEAPAGDVRHLCPGCTPSSPDIGSIPGKDRADPRHAFPQPVQPLSGKCFTPLKKCMLNWE